MKKIEQRSDCPVSYALDFFGDKWTFLIIRDMVFDGKRFYNDFLGSKEGVATNVLSDRLKRLEAVGVVESRVYEKLRTKKEYLLTEKGKDLIPVLVEMMAWSARHKEALAVPDGFAEKVRTNREAVLEAVYAGLE